MKLHMHRAPCALRAPVRPCFQARRDGQLLRKRQSPHTCGAADTEERAKVTNSSPDMNAAAKSSKEAQREERKKDKRPKKESAGQNGKSPRQAPVRSGPVSNLKNVNASKKQKRFAKGQKTGRQADKGQAALASRDGQVVPKSRKKQKDGASLDDINPFVIGQRSRAMLENVWKRFVSLGAPGQVSLDSDSLGSLDSDTQDPDVYVAPEASVTNVLVIGATGRVGRVLVRKLQLRGYPVRVLVRPNQAETTYFPESVKILTGEVGDYQAMRAAMQGVDKIIYVANARTPLTADVARVSDIGVMTAAKALQDERNDGISPSSGGLKAFASAKIRITGARQSDRITKRRMRWQGWQITHTGPPSESRQQESRARKYAPIIQDKSELWLNKRQNLIFSGNLFTRTSFATAKLDLDGSGLDLGDTVGLVIRVKGDKQTYAVLLTLENGDSYTARFPTTGSFQNIRIPYKAFRRTEETVGEAAQQLDPGAIRSLTLRVDLKNQTQTRRPKTANKELTSLSDSSTEGAFRLELNRVHALPGGAESDFILLSCAGVKTRDIADPEVFESSIRVKRMGEEKLRCSGLSYTIIRPGPIIDEPGGYKALVFDQGNRIQQSISRADVADVCVKSLHDPAARNKTFDVCHEYTPEAGIEKYELVAHLPDKANSYLTPALVNLERET